MMFTAKMANGGTGNSMAALITLKLLTQRQQSHAKLIENTKGIRTRGESHPQTMYRILHGAEQRQIGN